MSNPRRRLLPLVLACLIAIAAQGARTASAQEALVLSGGGARGLAHVGVLQRLEELGYDPDLVIGNSMGAVVGALYAAGYDAAEVRARVLEVRWAEMFDPTPVLLGAARDLRLPMLTFNLDPAERRAGRGLFGEWRINRALAHLLFDASARARGDFDRLARRYRAIAADLKTGEKVVLAEGDLARATRASMAYPGFFAPVRWGERILVDGGIADDLPTIEARRLGASRVVAVDVSRPTEEVESLAPLSVVQRALRLMQRNLHPDPLAPDILIAPATGEAFVGPAFPDDPVPLIERGAEAVTRDFPAPAAPAGKRQRAIPAAPDSLVGLRIEAPDVALAGLARTIFGAVAPGPYDAGAVLAAVDRLYGTGLVEGVWPRVTDDEEGRPTLEVRVDAPPRLSLAASAGFENDRGGRAWVAVERQTAVWGRPGLLTLAGSTDGLQRWAALSVRLHAGVRPSIAWTMGTHLQELSVRTFGEDTRSTVEVLRAGGWLGLDFPHILRERALTVAGRAEWLDPEDGPGGRSLGPLLRLSSVPSNAAVVGVPLLVEAEARWGARPYRRATLAASWSRAGRALQSAALVDLRAVTRRAPADVLPALGDQHAVPGLRWGEMRDRARAVAGVDLALPLPVGGFARLRLRTGTVAGEPGDWTDSRWIAGAQLGGVWRIPFGTLEAGYGHATTGDGRFDLSVGRDF